MDWDGVGTFALFLSSGAVGLGFIALRAYKAKLASKLEWERLRRSDTAPDEMSEQVQSLENQVHQLKERVDFTEGLLGEGKSESSDSDAAV